MRRDLQFCTLFQDENYPSGEEKLFRQTHTQGIYMSSGHSQSQLSEDEQQEVIEEELLKKTSQLHEALRNLKVLRFQLIEAKIMKKQNSLKCSQFELKQANLQKRKIDLQQQNAELKKEIELRIETIKRQKERNHLSYQKLSDLEKQLNKAKLEHKGMINNSIEIHKICQDKQNNSEIANHRYISLEKMSLQAANTSSKEMIALIKQEIISARGQLQHAETKKRDLQQQYKSLLEALKIKQARQESDKNNLNTYRDAQDSKNEIHSKQTYEIGSISGEIVENKKHNNQSKRKQPQNTTSKQKQYTVGTENKNKMPSKNIPTNLLTCKKYKMF